MVTAIKKRAIPDKLYFKIGEVCEITDTKPHTLRFWESEFKVIRPKRVSGNQRLYRRVDIETIFKIKHLIYEEGHTIAGTKKFLANKKKGVRTKKKSIQVVDSELLTRIKTELLELKSILEK